LIGPQGLHNKLRYYYLFSDKLIFRQVKKFMFLLLVFFLTIWWVLG